MTTMESYYHPAWVPTQAQVERGVEWAEEISLPLWRGEEMGEGVSLELVEYLLGWGGYL